MFNLGRVLQFLYRLLRILIPFLLAVLLLAFLTEASTREDELVDLLVSWRFWLAVGLDTIPAFVVMGGILWLAGRFLNSVYQLDGWRQGMGFLLRYRCGLPGFGPWMKVEKGLVVPGKGEILERTGGPGHLVIYNDSAVVLEKDGKLTRVEGAGYPRVDPFEKIYDVIDLRPKQWLYTVSAMTKEGIPIHWDADIQYQISDDGKAPPAKSLYPLSEDAVFRAATCKWVFAPGGAEMMDWEGRVIIAATEGNLRTILARRRLDQLIGLTEEEEQAARESVQAELEEALRKAAPEVGAKILRVKLGNLKVDDAATQQWIKAWKARWQEWSAGLLAQGEASYVYEYETAKAEAQMQMLRQISRTLQRQLDSQAIPPQAIPKMVLMRLFSVLDRADFGASSRVFFPTQTLEALERIKAPLLSAPTPGAATITLDAGPNTVLVNQQLTITATVRDGSGIPVPDGTLVMFASDRGDVSPNMALTTHGQAATTFQAGNQPDTARVTAQAGSASDTTIITITT